MPEGASPAIRLMLVTDDRLLRGRDLVALCQAAEQGGVTSIQVRRPLATPRELAATVRAVLGAVRVPVLVSDRADVAIACGAAGVHLGPAEVPVQVIRRIAPRGFLIGASVGALAEVENGRGADYWAVGPVRVTDAVGGTAAALGVDGFAAIVRRGEGRPCIATGGIRAEDVASVCSVGGAGVAVATGILASHDAFAGARRYARVLPVAP
ncbi:MAG: thiamine-phosphate pyrophosphorylase [Gemmatimonadetes bacterium]|nr:thiamine-phosphate pyrophosphorylase [Gemmatimonadota bacterium]